MAVPSVANWQPLGQTSHGAPAPRSPPPPPPALLLLLLPLLLLLRCLLLRCLRLRCLRLRCLRLRCWVRRWIRWSGRSAPTSSSPPTASTRSRDRLATSRRSSQRRLPAAWNERARASKAVGSMANLRNEPRHRRGDLARSCQDRRTVALPYAPPTASSPVKPTGFATGFCPSAPPSFRQPAPPAGRSVPTGSSLAPLPPPAARSASGRRRTGSRVAATASQRH